MRETHHVLPGTSWGTLSDLVRVRVRVRVKA